MKKTISRRAWLAAVAVISTALSALPNWAHAITVDELQHSQWNSSYDVNRTRVQATLVLDGNTGYYDTNFGRGRISNVEYTFNFGGAAQVEGNWNFDGGAGTFVFFVTGNGSDLAFSGSWQSHDGRSGSWNGRFVQALQGGGGGGGAVTNGDDSTADPFASIFNGGGTVTYGDWQYNGAKGYYSRKCQFPAGGYQYVIYYPSKPDWVYWYNPAKQVFWCACPTVNHPRWGNDIGNGADLFLMASTKARNLADCRFPDAGDDGANFVQGTATDVDGSQVALGCPPSDLP
jgi:hypothetical protein